MTRRGYALPAILGAEWGAGSSAIVLRGRSWQMVGITVHMRWAGVWYK